MVNMRRQAWPIFAAMFAMFVIGVSVAYPSEQHGSQVLRASGVDLAQSADSSGGNMADKEVRFGIANTALWATATTNASNGSVNGGHDALTASGGAVPIVNMFTGEVIFGGVGSGLYGMFFYIVIAVFVAGLMVGRTPEWLGKKVEAREIKLVSLGVLVTPLAVLLSTGVALATKYGKPSIFASGPQGFSESLYAYMSQANNNGSAFAGYTGYYQPNPGNIGAHGITFADLLGGVTMLGARFAPIVLVLAVAGTLASKRIAPQGLGTLRTDTPTFVALLGGTVVLIGALTFFPALLLGPVVQGMTDRLF
jgi:K+-transporting ATPase ATPase A chain